MNGKNGIYGTVTANGVDFALEGISNEGEEISKTMGEMFTRMMELFYRLGFNLGKAFGDGLLVSGGASVDELAKYTEKQNAKISDLMEESATSTMNVCNRELTSMANNLNRTFSNLTSNINRDISNMASNISRDLNSIPQNMSFNVNERRTVSYVNAYAFGGIVPHATGSIIAKPTFTQYKGQTQLFGEAGREAILPLDSYTGWMELADRKSVV